MDVKKLLAGIAVAGSLVAASASGATAAKPTCDDVFSPGDCDDGYDEVGDRSGGKAGTSR